MKVNIRYIIAMIFEILILLFFILSMIYSFKIKADTSSGNPFEQEEESDKINYFKYNISNYNPDKVYSILGENALIRKFTQCQEIQNKIINESLKLKDIFKLKTGSIHTLIITLIILDIITFIISIIYFPAIELFIIYQENKFNREMEMKKKMKKEEEEEDLIEKEKDCWKKLMDCCDNCHTIFVLLSIGLLILGILIIIALAILIAFIAIIIIYIIICWTYNTDDTNKYLDFLECPNVNKEGFYKYCLLGDLSSHFLAYKIVESFYIITIFSSGLYTLLEKFISP